VDLVNEPVADLPIEELVVLVNEYADATRSAAGESMDNYPELAIPVAATASRAELVATANHLHPIFADSDRAVDRLNRMADINGLTHRLGPDGRLRWSRPAYADSLECAALAGLIDFVSAHGTTVLGVCGADNCVDIYIDTSQAHIRRYCSARCNNKARAARWRARHRAGSDQDR